MSFIPGVQLQNVIYQMGFDGDLALVDTIHLKTAPTDAINK